MSTLSHLMRGIRKYGTTKTAEHKGSWFMLALGAHVGKISVQAKSNMHI